MRWLLFLLLPAAFCRAERVVLRDNTVQTGTLSAVEGANLVIRTAGGVQRIPIARIAAILFDDAGAPAAVVSGAGVPPSGPDPVAPIVSANVQTVGSLRVELTGCSKQGTTGVRCGLQVTNTGVDRQVRLTNGSTFVDSKGFERRAASVALGSGRGNVAVTSLISGVPVSASLQFPAVEPGVNSLAKLTVVWVDGRQVEVSFRNVPLQGN